MNLSHVEALGLKHDLVIADIETVNSSLNSHFKRLLEAQDLTLNVVGNDDIDIDHKISLALMKLLRPLILSAQEKSLVDVIISTQSADVLNVVIKGVCSIANSYLEILVVTDDTDCHFGP